jgi:L-ribulose-5-phosphate 3-epimerase
MLRRSAWAAAAASVVGPGLSLLAASPGRRYKVGACDWSIGKMGDPGAFEVAKQIGLDGVQVSLGTAANNMRLRQPEVQQAYKDAVLKTGLEVASLAIGELNEVPYKSDPRTVDWVRDSIDACRALGARVVLLAFFGKGDLRDDPAGVDEVVKRLTAVAPRAEQMGVSLAIESWLSAEKHMEIIDRVGSKAVRVYYDVCNSNDRGYDIYKEIPKLGKLICEVHAKENGALLGKGKVNFQKVRSVLEAIDYSGWIQIEGAVPPGGQMLEAYQANCKFLRGIFAG